MMSDRRSGNLRLVGAGLLIVGGAIHTWLAFDRYGTADLESVFFVNGAASALVAAAIVLSRGVIAPVAGVGLSAVSLVAFLLSRIGDGVLGFRATGLDPVPEAPLTLLVEGAALVVLGFVSIARRKEFVDGVSDALPG